MGRARNFYAWKNSSGGGKKKGGNWLVYAACFRTVILGTIVTVGG